MKLRYYNPFESEINPEKYTLSNPTKSQRSIETGRFTNETCLLCNSGEIEDKFQFLYLYEIFIGTKLTMQES